VSRPATLTLRRVAGLVRPGVPPLTKHPHSMVAERYHGGDWHEMAQLPVGSPMRGVDDLQRWLEVVSGVVALFVYAECLDEDQVHVRVPDDRDRTIATVHGDGRITTTGNPDNP